MESMFGHHISAQYNEELEDLRNRVLNMGGLVEQQIADAVTALVEGDGERCEQVINRAIMSTQWRSRSTRNARAFWRVVSLLLEQRLIVAIIKTITGNESVTRRRRLPASVCI